MGLADFVPASETVIFGKGESDNFKVGALALNDLMTLFRLHSEDLEVAFKMYLEGEKEGFKADWGYRLLLKASRDMPGLVANTIACGAGDLTLAGVAMLLPLPVQYDAFEKILLLTFQDHGGVKNFAAVLKNLYTAALAEVPGQGGAKLRSALSVVGSGASAQT